MNDKQQDESIENLQIAIKELNKDTGYCIHNIHRRLEELERLMREHSQSAKLDDKILPQNSSDEYEEIDCDTNCCEPYEGYSGTHVKKSFDLGFNKGKLAGLKEALDLHFEDDKHYSCWYCMNIRKRIQELEKL